MDCGPRVLGVSCMVDCIFPHGLDGQMCICVHFTESYVTISLYSIWCGYISDVGWHTDQ